MADEDEGDQTPPAPPPPPNPDARKTFSQEEVNAMMAREKDEGRRSATTKLLEDLGFKNKDEIKQFLDQAKADQDAKLTEADRKTREAEAAQAKATAAQAKALEKLVEAYKRSELVAAGVPLKDVPTIARLVDLPDNLDIEDEKAFTEAVSNAVKDLKKGMPHLFGATQPPASHPPGAPPGGKSQPNADDARKAMLLKLNPQLAKQKT